MKREIRVTARLNHKSNIAELHRREVSRIDRISPEEEFSIAMLAREGDEVAKEKLITSNLRFVLSMAKNFSTDPTTLDDLISAGNMGLVEAADKFDPTKGFKFISYAVWHIRKQMLNHIYENSKTVRIPVSKMQLLARSKSAASEFLTREGREPTPEETVDWMNSNLNGKKINLSYLNDLYQADSSPLSLDAPMGIDGNPLSEIVGEDDRNLSEIFNERGSIALSLLSTLNEKEKFIVSKRIGMGEEPWTFTDIASECGKSAEWTRSQYNRAIKKMRLRAEKHLKEGSI